MTALDRNISGLSLKRLKEVLTYNPVTGNFWWNFRTGPTCKLDAPAGTIKTQGYRRIAFDGVSYTASHLAWFWFYGERPGFIIDHQNGKYGDNRIHNLRRATSSQNSMNMGRSKSNTTGFKGVAVYNKEYTKAKFRASIRVDGKRIFLGLFHTAESAAAAYQAAARKYHGEFAKNEETEMNRQDFNTLRKRFAGNPSAIERCNLLERQEREARSEAGLRRDLLLKFMARTAEEMKAVIAPKAA